MRRSGVGNFAGVVAAAALVLTGCDLGTSKPSSTISPCFRALPQASRAAAPHGRLVSVHRTTGSRVGEALADVAPGQPAIKVDGSVCVVAYKSAGTAGPTVATVTPPTTAPGQPYIVVVIDEQKLTVVGLVHVDRLPRPMHHR